MPTSPRGVVWEELEGSPEWQQTLQGQRAQRIFRVPSLEDGYKLAADLWGGILLVGAVKQRATVAQFPALPEGLAESGLLVTEVSVQPMNGDAPKLPAEGMESLEDRHVDYPDPPGAGAKVTVTYESVTSGGGGPQQQQDDGTVISLRTTTGAEYLTVPGRTWHWQNNTGPRLDDDIAPGILIPTEQLTFTWSRVVTPPFDTIESLRGKVNNAAWTPPVGGRSHVSETVLFLGATITTDTQPDGTEISTVQYDFSAKTVHGTASGTIFGWNHFYRNDLPSGTEHWVNVTDEDNNPPYQLGDFTTLFPSQA